MQISFLEIRFNIEMALNRLAKKKKKRLFLSPVVQRQSLSLITHFSPPGDHCDKVLNIVVLI